MKQFGVVEFDPHHIVDEGYYNNRKLFMPAAAARRLTGIAFSHNEPQRVYFHDTLEDAIQHAGQLSTINAHKEYGWFSMNGMFVSQPAEPNKVVFSEKGALPE